jgi:ferrous iron transport protein B
MEIILAGRPNSGKSTLFNRLASANQKVGNYAGCTVEKKTADLLIGERTFELTDLPGLYSLKANTVDEEVALKHLAAQKKQSHIVVVLDGNNLEQELILPMILKSQGYSISVAVNMIDELKANKKILNLVGMTDLAGVPFFGISAKTGEGLNSLKKFLENFGAPETKSSPPLEKMDNESISRLFKAAKAEAKKIESANPRGPDRTAQSLRNERLDRILVHKILGPIIFIVTMFVLFQSVFTWAKPLSDFLDQSLKLLGSNLAPHIANPMLSSLVSDGIIGGIGAVLVFVPPIALLFFFIGLLELSGYLPRAAYMVDRLMKPYGLDGKVFIPLLSSVACAVPGIMATRTIENERTRIMTILISPLMTCSARLPVYTLLISSFIPAKMIFGFNLQGLVMFSMYMLAIVMALVVALVLHKFAFKEKRSILNFIHLPSYRMPDWRSLIRYVWSRINAFLRKAGTIIASMAVLLWILLSFPRTEILRPEMTTGERQKAVAVNLQNSYGGQIGKALEPVFRPLGYDWRLTIGILSSLAAREVFVSTLGTVFALGEIEGHTESLSKVLQEEKGPDGRPLYTVATCLSLLVFFAFSLQCISTIGTARRETNSWKIPAIMFLYMFVLAYGSAFAVYQLSQAFL